MIGAKAPWCSTKTTLGKLPKGIYGVDVSVYVYPAKYNERKKGKGSHVRVFVDMVRAFASCGHGLLMVFDGPNAKTKTYAREKRTRERDRKLTILADVLAHITRQGQGQAFLHQDADENELLERAQHVYENSFMYDNVSEEDIRVLEQNVRNTVRVTKQDMQDLKDVFDAMGVPWVVADGEADHVLAYLSKRYVLSGVVSEDSDMLVHGVEKLVHGLGSSFRYHRGVDSTKPVTITKLRPLLDHLKVSYSDFVRVCTMAGCDYCDKVHGIGCISGIEYIKRCGGFSQLVSAIRAREAWVPPIVFFSDEEHVDRVKRAIAMFLFHVDKNVGAAEKLVCEHENGCIAHLPASDEEEDATMAFVCTYKRLTGSFIEERYIEALRSTPLSRSQTEIGPRPRPRLRLRVNY